MQRKLVIWGGNGRSLNIDQLDSHASVTAFFLTKYLSDYYKIVNITRVDAPDELLKHPDSCGILSTFQRGFTNQLILKGKEDIFFKILDSSKGPLCSVYDYNYADTRYYEDIIFAVRPVDAKNAESIRMISRNPHIQIHEMGWCADPDFCYPEDVEGITLFVDHPPYTSGEIDFSRQYYRAFHTIRQIYPDLSLTVLRQDNDGVTSVDIRSKMPSIAEYTRSNKVPWKTMIAHYRKARIFCVTTPQSACLSAAEAAMCGAIIYVPRYRLRTSFIPDDLLTDEIPFRTFRSSRGIVSTLKRDLSSKIDRTQIHRALIDRHSWQRASICIRDALMRYKHES